MNSKAKNELYSIKRELDSIIKELDSISCGVKNKFSGIGNEKCADCIDKVTAQYCTVKKKLNNIDTSKLTGEGGGGFR